MPQDSPKSRFDTEPRPSFLTPFCSGSPMPRFPMWEFPRSPPPSTPAPRGVIAELGCLSSTHASRHRRGRRPGSGLHGPLNPPALPRDASCWVGPCPAPPGWGGLGPGHSPARGTPRGRGEVAPLPSGAGALPLPPPPPRALIGGAGCCRHGLSHPQVPCGNQMGRGGGARWAGDPAVGSLSPPRVPPGLHNPPLSSYLPLRATCRNPPPGVGLGGLHGRILESRW